MRLQRRRSRTRAVRTDSRPARRRLFVESLEPRALLAADSGGFISSTTPETCAGESVAAVGPIMRFTTRVLAPGTDTPITTILAGRDFDMQIRVEDLRGPEHQFRGVYAAYADLLYDKTLAQFRVLEIQNIVFSSLAGSFTLSMDSLGTTASIQYDLNVEDPGLAVQTALNSLLGPGTVQVLLAPPERGGYDIRFVGRFDQDLPLMQSSDATITVTEIVNGDATLSRSFTESFRSRDIGLENGLPGPYQEGLHAIDADDRVDDLGAFGIQGSRFLRELARARVKAKTPHGPSGTLLVFTPNVTDLDVPAHNNFVFANITDPDPCKRNSLVPAEAVLTVPASLLIRNAVVAAVTSATIDEDNTAGVTIPLLHLVSKDPEAPAGLIELRDFSQSASGTTTRLDPNNTPNNFTDDLVRFVPAPNFNGRATFTYTAGIVGNAIPEDVAVGTVTVNVNAVNDAPVNSLPLVQNTLEDVPIIFSAAGNNAISVADVDADPAGVQVALAVSGGLISLATTTGLTVTIGDGMEDAAITFRGTTAAVNAALSDLRFAPTPESTGVVRLSVATSDLGNSGKIAGVSLFDQDTITIVIAPVNDAPLIAAPLQQSVFSVNVLGFSPAYGNAIVISDVDAGSDPVMVTLGTTNNVGRLRATAVGNAQVVGSDSFEMSITGSQADVNATLGTLELVPQQSISGTLTVNVSDQGHNPPGAVLTAQATIAITVLPAVGPFAANDVPVDLVEGSAGYLIDVLFNDLANGAADATLVSFTQPPPELGSVERFTNGTLLDLTDDKLRYTPPLKNGLPDLNFFTPLRRPPITFAYVVNQSPASGAPDSLPGTVSIRIANVPDEPVANEDGVNRSYATSIGVPYSRTAAQGLLVNDTAIDNTYGDSQLVSLTAVNAVPAPGSGEIGTLVVNLDGSFQYTPPPAFEGDATFTYRAKSSLGPESAPGRVTIHVSRPPLPVEDLYTTAIEDQPFNSPTSVVLNDQDVDGEELSAVLVSNVSAAAGSVTLTSDGFFTYTPALHFNTTRPAGQPITFTYKVTAPSGRESSPNQLGTVSIVVNERNDNPTANGDTFGAIAQRRQLGVNQLVPVLGNDNSDPDGGETLTVIGVNGVLADASGNTPPVPTTGGGVVRLEGFQIKYSSPIAAGSDSFAYTISDGRNGTATAQVLVSVEQPYDFGDAPESYKTSLVSNGARHIAIGPQLGPQREDEADGVPSAAASGDDQAEIDDEDGLTAATLVQGKTSSLTVAVVAEAPGASLDAWIDFNRDGVFTVEERIPISNPVSTGNQQVTFPVPAAALLGSTIARVCISTAGGLAPTGLAADGEVEDHVVTVLQEASVVLPSGTGPNQVAIRKNGENIEVVNAATSAAIGSWPLARVHSIVIRGSDADADEIVLDYSTGGFFTLPGGIQVDAGAGSGDKLIVQGVAGGGTSAQYVSQGQALGTGTLRTESGGVQSEIRFQNFEPVELNVGTFTVTGPLNIGAQTLTFPASVQAQLGAETILAGGKIVAPGGLSLAAGQVLRGHGTIETPNDPAQPLVNNGSIQGISASEPITIMGYVTGLGSLNHVHIAGTLSPGASPAAVTYGNVVFEDGSVLIAEIGGVTPGAGFDQLTFTGSVELNGTLNVVLINAFVPQIDDGFTIISAGAGLSGEFLSQNLPTVPADRKWKVLKTASEFRLAMPTSRPWHNRFKPRDVNNDTAVAAEDALFVVNFINTFNAGPVPADAEFIKPFYDVDGDNFVAAGDALEIINAINSGLTGEPEGEAPQEDLNSPTANGLEALISLLAEEASGASQRRRRIP